MSLFSFFVPFGMSVRTMQLYIHMQLHVLVVFAEFSFEHLFDIWESVWSARQVISQHMEEFIALAMFLQFKSAVLDAHLSPSDVLSLLNSEYNYFVQYNYYSEM